MFVDVALGGWTTVKPYVATCLNFFTISTVMVKLLDRWMNGFNYNAHYNVYAEWISWMDEIVDLMDGMIEWMFK